jgi:hypothetical protein
METIETPQQEAARLFAAMDAASLLRAQARARQEASWWRSWRAGQVVAYGVAIAGLFGLQLAGLDTPFRLALVVVICVLGGHLSLSGGITRLHDDIEKLRKDLASRGMPPS